MDKIEINLNEKVDEEITNNHLKNSRTLKELVESFVELEQNRDKMCLYCTVCNPPDTNIGTAATSRPGVFFYNAELENDFEKISHQEICEIFLFHFK